MNNKGNNREELIREVLGGILRQSTSSVAFEDADHLDNDVMAAFVEGNLSEREAKPVTTHLVDCSFCRHKSAELVRLDLRFAEEQIEAPSADSEPAKVSDVLSGILGKIFGAGEGAVFAHQDDEAVEKKEKDEEE
ncbi:MAG: hypothetical protein DWQ47_09720 [Acidobacteria bacterium]|nr:MAG: hypothetical protein DWQ32_17820 [Acidobacteriota bacterium]REJ98826.1 MAG: hypothetical protein DWQ38_12155 [Acidobacteriota bacterium]REK16454.1 MAG: hypothetical protein DWQ43_05530 [Acidobacteriota bacterium]REK44135.1 MAG: hypothetical protein DWQ47_09720 [Acidobacteriota bacterium]